MPSLLPAPLALAQQPASPAGSALPDIHQLMREVHEHQKQLDKVRENYTYTSLQTTQDLDSNGHVAKTETHEFEVFYVNDRLISRLVKKDGKPLDDHDQQKETERVTKAVEKAENPEPDQQKKNQESAWAAYWMSPMCAIPAARAIVAARPSSSTLWAAKTSRPTA